MDPSDQDSKSRLRSQDHPQKNAYSSESLARLA